MVVAHSTITSLALNFLVIIHIGCKQGHSPRNVFYIFRQQGYLLYKQSLFRPITGPEDSRRLRLPDSETIGT
jgi:hypothetical protein